MRTRYDLVTSYSKFAEWLETCPVHFRFVREDEDYITVGFFSVVDEEE